MHACMYVPVVQVIMHSCSIPWILILSGTDFGGNRYI